MMAAIKEIYQVSMAKELADTNIYDPAFSADPFTFYQTAHKSAPILYLPALESWLITGADEITTVCSRIEDFSNDISSLLSGIRAKNPAVKNILNQGWPQVQVLLMSDPPDHARYRRLVGLAFSASRVSAIEEKIRQFSRQILDSIPQIDAWDFIHHYAIPLPVAVIADQLGFSNAERDKVRIWSDAFTDRLGGMIDETREIACAKAVIEFQHAMKVKIDQRRSEQFDDLLGDLVTAASEGDAPLTDAEILSVIQQLMVAGNETTTSALTEGLKLLITHPEQMQLLRDQPDLMKNAVEEILRLASPVAGSWRIATKDTTLNGHAIKRGEKLMIRLAAASRDPSRFSSPDNFDITRANAKLHFAFSRGIHTCLGNMLARKEIMVALEHLLARFRSIELSEPVEALTYTPNVMLRGLASLTIKTAKI
jgi:cytochrome P450